jgi:hypothetical protein
LTIVMRINPFQSLDNCQGKSMVFFLIWFICCLQYSLTIKTTCMIRIIIILFITLAFLQQVIAQKTPKNFAGILLVYEGANMSTSVGGEYERFLYASRNMVVGVRGTFIKKYDSRNFDLSFFGTTIGFPPRYDIQLSQLMLNGYYYLSGDNQPRGIFIGGGPGMIYSLAKANDKRPGEKERYESIMPGMEFNAGIQFPITRKMAFRGMFTLDIYGAQDGPFDHRRLVLLSSKITIGF